jgi:hypothetical protein
MIAAGEQMTPSSTIVEHTIEVHYWSESIMSHTGRHMMRLHNQ